MSHFEILKINKKSSLYHFEIIIFCLKKVFFSMRDQIPIFRTDAWHLYLKGHEVFSKDPASGRINILKPDQHLPYEYFDTSKTYGLFLDAEETKNLKKMDHNQMVYMVIGICLFIFGLVFIFLSNAFSSISSVWSDMGIVLLFFAMMTLPSILFNELNQNRYKKNIKIKYGVRTGY